MVEWTSTATGLEQSFHNFGLRGNFDVPMTSLTPINTATSQAAIWKGTAQSGANESLEITQTVRINANDMFFVINVVMTNKGTETLRSLEYMRNVDPDHEQPWSGDFTTRNWVEAQPPRAANGSRMALAALPYGNTNRALAVAEGLDYGLTLGLGTIDSRAVVAASQGFSNRDTDAILDAPNQPTQVSPSIDDAAIVLTYELGDLAPGQSVSIDYAYILNSADLEVAMGSLAAVTILQPTGTVSGDSVIFQATTNNIPNTQQVAFYVNGTLIATDTSPSASGVYETSFDSLPLANGTAVLKAIATFASGELIEKSTTITVENSGPPISFSSPTAGDVFSGSDIPISINIDDPSHPPARVSFFRETAGSGSVSLGEATAAPLTALFSVTDLPAGETVVIKAVANDILDRSTTIQVSGTVSSSKASPFSSILPAGHKLLNSHHRRSDRR